MPSRHAAADLLARLRRRIHAAAPGLRRATAHLTARVRHRAHAAAPRLQHAARAAGRRIRRVLRTHGTALAWRVAFWGSVALLASAGPSLFEADAVPGVPPFLAGLALATVPALAARPAPARLAGALLGTLHAAAAAAVHAAGPWT